MALKQNIKQKQFYNKIKKRRERASQTGQAKSPAGGPPSRPAQPEATLAQPVETLAPHQIPWHLCKHPLPPPGSFTIGSSAPARSLPSSRPRRHRRLTSPACDAQAQGLKLRRLLRPPAPAQCPVAALSRRVAPQGRRRPALPSLLPSSRPRSSSSAVGLLWPLRLLPL
jgi:hypothetical protein